jgi:hypothetical protein
MKYSELWTSNDIIKTLKPRWSKTRLSKWYTKLHPLLRSIVRMPLYLVFPTLVLPITITGSSADFTEKNISIITAYTIFLFIWTWDFTASYILFRFKGTKNAKKLQQEVNERNHPIPNLLIGLYCFYCVGYAIMYLARTYVPDLTPYLPHQPNLFTLPFILVTVLVAAMRLFFW